MGRLLALGLLSTLALAACTSAPMAVPSATGYAAPSFSDPAMAGDIAACGDLGTRREQITCLLPRAEEAFAEAYTPVVTSRGVEFTRPKVVTPDRSAETACGTLSRVAYCPSDATIVLPLDFLSTIGDRAASEVEWGPKTMGYFSAKLTPEQMSSGGDFGAITALAHEYAHHVQSLIGYERVNADLMEAQPAKASFYSSEFELMADCFAGWMAATLDQGGVYQVEGVDQWAAVTALAEVGDDFIQERRGGTAAVQPSQTFNHGAANERANAWVEGAGYGFDGREPYQACLTLADQLIDGRTGANPTATQ